MLPRVLGDDVRASRAQGQGDLLIHRRQLPFPGLDVQSRRILDLDDQQHVVATEAPGTDTAADGPVGHGHERRRSQHDRDRAISQLGKTIPKSELEPGDLVFFNTLRSTFSHVGIYLGNNRFINSPSSGGGVRVEDMQDSYWQKRFNGAQRIEASAKGN